MLEWVGVDEMSTIQCGLKSENVPLFFGVLTGIESDDAQIDLIFSTIDDLLHDGKFQVVDDVLDYAVWKVTELTDTLIVGFLTITLAAKDKLQVRPSLYHALASKLMMQHSEGEVQRMLVGLR